MKKPLVQNTRLTGFIVQRDGADAYEAPIKRYVSDKAWNITPTPFKGKFDIYCDNEFVAELRASDTLIITTSRSESAPLTLGDYNKQERGEAIIALAPDKNQVGEASSPTMKAAIFAAMARH